MEVGTVQQALCAQHPERVAVGTCDRCGSYHCASCAKRLLHKQLCSACLALPGVDYLRELRERAWGKRDGWVWYFGGFIGLVLTLTAIVQLLTGDYAAALISAVIAGLSISYFALQPWSRVALFAFFPLSVVVAVLTAPPGQSAAFAAGSGVGRGVIMMLFLIAAYRSTRNKLAFKLEVSDAELSEYHDRYVSNPHASRALGYGALSLVIPVLIPVAVFFGVTGYRKVNPNAWPPVGRRGQAIAGLAFAAVATVMWSIIAFGLARIP